MLSVSWLGGRLFRVRVVLGIGKHKAEESYAQL